MKTYAFRLHRGDDLRLALTRFARENHLRGAVVLSCVGCLSHWRLRDASGVNMQEKTEPVEIVSATGTLSQDRLHLHLSLSRKDLSTSEDIWRRAASSIPPPRSCCWSWKTWPSARPMMLIQAMTK